MIVTEFIPGYKIEEIFVLGDTMGVKRLGNGILGADGVVNVKLGLQPLQPRKQWSRCGRVACLRDCCEVEEVKKDDRESN